MKEGFRIFRYAGNVPEEGCRDTTCPEGGRFFIHRRGFDEITNPVQEEHCPDCATPIAGEGVD